MAAIGFGTTVVFGTSGFSAAMTAITDMSEEREVIDTTHMASPTEDAIDGYSQPIAESLPGVKTNGPIEMAIQYVPGTEPPINRLAETITVTFPTPPGGSKGAVFAGDGYVSNMSRAIEVKGMMTAVVTIQRDGKWTVADPT